MNFKEYQDSAILTAVYPEKMKILYPTLGLAGETGEVAEKIKKLYRDTNGELTPEFLEDMAKELGDVLWYLANLAKDLGLSLDGIAEENLTKLKSRLERNVIHGSGDNR